MAHSKNEKQYAAAVLIIKMALRYGGEIEVIAKALENALDNKITAISEKRYEDAAKYREVEVKKILELTELLEKYPAGK